MKIFSILEMVALSLFLVNILGCNHETENDTMANSLVKSSSVKITFGSDVYHIPMNYLTSKGDLPDDLVIESGLNLFFLLPDLDGVPPGFYWLGKYNPDVYFITVSARGSGKDLNADDQLKRGLKHKSMIRNPLKDLGEMQAYDVSFNEMATDYVVQTNHGNTTIISCNKGAVNDICKGVYYHQEKRFSVRYVFDEKYLSDWKSIDQRVLEMLEHWRD